MNTTRHQEHTMDLHTASANATLYARQDGVLYHVPSITVTDESGTWTTGYRWIASRGAFAKTPNDLAVAGLSLI